MGVNDEMRTCDLIDLFDGPPLVHHGVPYTKTRSVHLTGTKKGDLCNKGVMGIVAHLKLLIIKLFVDITENPL